MSNGERYKIGAKIVARRMAELNEIPYEEAIFDEKGLIEFAEKFMTWNEIKLDAQLYVEELPIDHAAEWKKCMKTIEFEPKPIKEKKIDPNVESPKPDFRTVKEEDEEEGGFGKGGDGEVVDLD